ncbi:MAG: hypothetical protein GDA68_03790 [Nitrospira sp. CR2.1]|nr:hypothetical protein [Nitrospira sp. CR2.1]MBA5873297.1 hypothetical protein [Nitrospira sp. CR1.2]
MTHRAQDYSTWVFLLLVAWWPTLVGAADGSGMKFYKVPEGQITYQLAGTQAGTETFSFTEYGNKTRRETHTSMEMMGISQRTDSVILTDGPWMYTLDPDKNQAIKRKNPMFGSFAEQSDLDRFKTGEDVMKALGGTKMGRDVVLVHGHRYDCDRWKLEQLMTTTCVTSDGIALWTKSGMANMSMQQTATAIKLGPVPPGITSLPADTHVVEGADPMESLRQFQQQGVGRSSARKRKKDKLLTPGEMREGEQMRELPQGKDFNQMMESMKKLQEQFNPKSDAPTQ